VLLKVPIRAHNRQKSPDKVRSGLKKTGLNLSSLKVLVLFVKKQPPQFPLVGGGKGSVEPDHAQQEYSKNSLSRDNSLLASKSYYPFGDES
jgi:hypothetical protein